MPYGFFTFKDTLKHQDERYKMGREQVFPRIRDNMYDIIKNPRTSADRKQELYQLIKRSEHALHQLDELYYVCVSFKRSCKSEKEMLRKIQVSLLATMKNQVNYHAVNQVSSLELVGYIESFKVLNQDKQTCSIALDLSTRLLYLLLSMSIAVLGFLMILVIAYFAQPLLIASHLVTSAGIELLFGTTFVSNVLHLLGGFFLFFTGAMFGMDQKDIIQAEYHYMRDNQVHDLQAFADDYVISAFANARVCPQGESQIDYQIN